MKYGDRDIHSVTSTRWDRLHLTSVQYSQNLKVSILVIQGNAIPVDQLLAFTYRQEHLIILNPLEVTSLGGSSFTIIDLPVGAKIARASGMQTEPVRFQLERQN